MRLHTRGQHTLATALMLTAIAGATACDANRIVLRQAMGGFVD